MIIKKQIKYEKKRIITDIKYRLYMNIRRRIHHALNGKSKSFSTIDTLGNDIETFRRMIEWQMTPEMKWSNKEINHVKPNCMFDVTKDEEIGEAFCWKNTPPLPKKDYQFEGTKFNFLDYQLQFIKSYQFLKLNEEGHNDNFH